MTPTTSQHWVLARKPTGRPIITGPEATFELTTQPIPTLGEEQVLLKVLFLSNDPAQRMWIDPNILPERLYTSPVEIGETMRSYSSIAEVVESTSKTLPVGALVCSTTGWCEYVVLPAETAMRIEPVDDLPPTHFSGIFGIAGVTAYYGLVDIIKAGHEDAIVISGAAGAVGSVAVQIAKNMLGCRKVIGIAGTDAKCQWVESLGADICLNYKSKTFTEDLKSATDGFVEVFFDNTGGEILDLMLTRMQKEGRVVACGAIADYNSQTRAGIKNWYDVIGMRLQIKGFVVTDAGPARWAAIVGALVQGYREGKIRVADDGQTIVPTAFEDIPKTWMRLFDGQSTGKLLTRLE
ncbi:uncharacterized protein TRUGW13939_10217 [Talaromyces rugulosus]|uniref:Enoyl reductase (ER) domain-containing protein n=1 Tax=Talaromyces rugulosus TaxID=121627 RepID=A0A7H8R9F0_TALRU|nr:uncharacterized protein TRUGW13939_10217 [Talaromyces rugulosus]QKX63049.1 hypothetical protein TRUGW13939_10217 [Talaromyces rugulosus]